MDPHATIAIIRDASAELADRLDALRNLASWLQIGGFVPADIDGARTLRFAITVATLCDMYHIATDRWPRHVVIDLLDRF